jgi:hypothetical protein
MIGILICPQEISESIQGSFIDIGFAFDLDILSP